MGSVRLCQLPQICEAQETREPRGEAAALRLLPMEVPGIGYFTRNRIRRIVVTVVSGVSIMGGT